MKFTFALIAAAAAWTAVADVESSFSVKRVFREARVTRGNTNVMKLQPVDDASWIWIPGDSGEAGRSVEWGDHPQADVSADAKFVAFRAEFETKEGDEPLTIDVSADERFYLTLDGRFVGRGPNRGTVENWQYETYEIAFARPGRHVMTAIVQKIGNNAPLAQLSFRGAFVLKASGRYDAELTTGKGGWKAAWVSGIKPAGTDNGVWGTGAQFEIVGGGPYDAEIPADRFVKAEVVRGDAGRRGPAIWGGRTGGWMLFPSQLPDQTEAVVRPGEIRAVTPAAGWRKPHVYTAEETKAPEVAQFNRLVRGEAEAVEVPARTRLQVAWDLGRYYCAYPRLKLAKGAGSRVSWTWTESARNDADKRKGHRDEIVGKFLEGFGDVFVADGKGSGVFSSPWFRCGRWCRLDIETGDVPLEIRDLSVVESRYPLEMESAFATPDDPSFADIRRICTRAMQMCCHEMLFDCPYYEQQMYPGDTRVQLQVLSALTRDDRMIKRAIEIYDLNTRDDGMCPMNYPTRGLQESLTYTLCYLCMYGDYVDSHADRAWLRARLPGLRKSMAGCEYYENASGLLENVPGWCFMDWTVGWDSGGTAPGSRMGEGVNAEINLFWLLAMQSAAKTERALGNALQAAYWEEKAARLKEAIVTAFWSDARGLVADTPARKDFSEHAQALAILADALPKEKAETAFGHLVADADLKRCTVYFTYYLFDAYFKMGRADLFLKRLDLWRDYVKIGVTTLLESPDSGKNGQIEARSDCHAWGAHPLWFMQTGLAGVRSAAPFFEKVRIAPCPGGLRRLTVRHPHPKGWIEADLAFDGEKVSGAVTTPVPGTFVYGGRETVLKAGLNTL